jgi:hypothetical protein
MKKVIRLTESDLVNIVKRVINEQTENGPVINKDTKIEIPSDVLSQFQKYKFNNVESGGTFLDKINQGPINVNIYRINSEGFNFPIEVLSLNKQIGDIGLRLSCEPLNPENGKCMVKLTKTIPYKK